MSTDRERVDVVVVGGGPAGLTAARSLREAGVASVVLLEREAEAGGIPRHSDHTGYGMRDLRRLTTGPTYARRLVDAARAAGVDLRTSSTVTGWEGERVLAVTSPSGRTQIEARAVVLATGARERPRTARMIPGDRPAGVLTTGQLQNLVHMQHQQVGHRAVIVGAELVSWSAVLTLREAGCATVLMTTRHDRAESYAAFTIPGRVALRVPVARRTRVTRVLGRHRVTAVEVEDCDSGVRRLVECDTVVFTGDWVPDNELARLGGLDIDAAHLGPLVDTALRTSAPGVFAAGNLLHPVDTADVAALDGRHVAEHIRRFLDGESEIGAAVRLRVDPPLLWVAPGIVRSSDVLGARGKSDSWVAPARNRLTTWADASLMSPRVSVTQDGTVVGHRRLPWPMSPGRVFRIPWSLLENIDPRGGDVTLSVR